MLKKIIFIFLLILISNTKLFAEWNLESGKISMPKNYDVGNLSKFKKGVKLTKSGEKFEKKNKIKKAKKKYEKALDYFLIANKERQGDVEILSYLGFISTKLGNINNAEIYYLLGLSIDPEHLEINGHLGELYFRSNRIDLANERLKILENCNCIQYKFLKEIITQ